MKISTSTRNTTIIVVFAFLFMVLAASIHAFNINDYMASTESPASVTQANVSVNGISYVVYSLAGKESMIVNGETIVQDRDEISLVLNAECFDTSYPSSADLNEINSYILSFNNSRQQSTSFGPRETSCDQSVGQVNGDEGGCVDLTSCQISCNEASYTCFQYAEGSAMFLPALLEYANIKRSIDKNVSEIIATNTELKGVSSAAQISFNLSSKISKISSDITALQNESTNYIHNKLFVNQDAGGFQQCIYPGETTVRLNTSALSSAATKATILLSKTSCFSNVSSRANQLLNNTLSRIDIYVNTKEKFTIQDQFNALSTRYNTLTDKANMVTNLITDTTIPQYITDVEALDAKYYGYVNKNQYDQAGLTVSQISSKLDAFEAYLNSTSSVFEPLIQNKTNALTLLNKGSVVIESSDATMSADLSTLRNRYTSLSAKLSSKITPDQVPSYASQFEDIANQTSVLINKKRQIEAERVPQMLSDTMRSISVVVLNSISGPLGISETDKRAWISNIPLIIIVFIDIVILAIFSAAFFFLVLKDTKDFMKPKVMQSWGVIFVVVLLVLVGLSYALYSSLTTETGSVSSFAFMKQVKAQPTVSLFVERLSSDDQSAINNCSAKIQVALKALNISVTTTEIIDGVCTDKPLANCLAETQNPMIRLQYSNITNSTAFYTFYKTESIIQGDSQYFSTCIISQLIG